MCRAGIRHCRNSWSRDRKLKDNARRRRNTHAQRARDTADRSAVAEHLAKRDEAQAEMDSLAAQLAEHAENLREPSRTESTLAAMTPADRAGEMRSFGIRATVGEDSVEFASPSPGGLADEGMPARDPHGDEPRPGPNAPVGGVWASPDSAAGGGQPVTGDRDAVIAHVSTRGDAAAMNRLFPADDPTMPFSYSGARASGVDAVRVTGNAMDGWGESRTVWLTRDHLVELGSEEADAAAAATHREWAGDRADVAEREALAAHAEWAQHREEYNGEPSSRCGRCGTFVGEAHDCPGPAAEELATWRESLDDRELEAVDDYRSLGHAELNEKLRAGGGTLPESLTDDDLRTIAGMDSALSRAPRAQQAYVVHRGIRTGAVDSSGNARGVTGQEWVAEHARAGQEVTFHGYTSTSLDPDQARYFSGAGSEYATSGVLFEITTSQGGNWPTEGREAEVTLSRGSRFEVIEVDPTNVIDGKPYPLVRLREVDGAGSGARD